MASEREPEADGRVRKPQAGDAAPSEGRRWRLTSPVGRIRHPSSPEIDRLIDAWDIIHPSSHARLRQSLDKYVALVESGAPGPELAKAKEEQVFWWMEYRRDMTESLGAASKLLDC